MKARDNKKNIPSQELQLKQEGRLIATMHTLGMPAPQSGSISIPVRMQIVKVIGSDKSISDKGLQLKQKGRLIATMHNTRMLGSQFGSISIQIRLQMPKARDNGKSSLEK
jgi:hypothetical protein